jgi:hypothetical protein
MQSMSLQVRTGEQSKMNTYEVLISDIRVFKITVQADSIEAANELADVALESGYEEHGELVEVRDPSVDDVFSTQSPNWSLRLAK